MIIFYLISAVIYVIAFLSMYSILNKFEKTTKWKYMIGVSIIIYGITAFVVYLQTNGINMNSDNNIIILKKAMRVFFAPINTFVIGSLVATILNKGYDISDGTEKEKKSFVRTIVLCLIVFCLFVIGVLNYMPEFIQLLIS